MFPVQANYSLQLTCEVSQPEDLNRARRRALGARRGRVPKQRELAQRARGIQQMIDAGLFVTRGGQDSPD